MLYLIIVVFLTLGISALCSLSEAAFYSSRIPYIESKKEKYPQNKGIRIYLDMKNKVEIPITTILILNTIANTAGATISGMFAARQLGEQWIPLFSIALTAGILIFSEILPKTYGAVAWKHLWRKISWPIFILSRILWPLIKLSQVMLRIVTGDNKAMKVSEDEILAIVNLGAKTGEISQEENTMIKNILKLENVQLDHIMTPRTIIFSLEENLSLEQARKLAEKKEFSRIPVYKKDKENITGYIRFNDLVLSKNIQNTNLRLKDIIRPIIKKPAMTNCSKLLQEFLTKRTHIAVILDEYFQVDGLVTLEDIIETMLGYEIVDESDKIVDLQKEAKKKLNKNFNKEQK